MPTIAGMAMLAEVNRDIHPVLLRPVHHKPLRLIYPSHNLDSLFKDTLNGALLHLLRPGPKS